MQSNSRDRPPPTLRRSRYGKLMPLYFERHFDLRDPSLWVLRCDCGRRCYASTWSLERGLVTSCGCTPQPWQQPGGIVPLTAKCMGCGVRRVRLTAAERREVQRGTPVQVSCAACRRAMAVKPVPAPEPVTPSVQPVAFSRAAARRKRQWSAALVPFLEKEAARQRALLEAAQRTYEDKLRASKPRRLKRSLSTLLEEAELP